MSGHVTISDTAYLVGCNEMVTVFVLLDALCIAMKLPLLQPAHLHTHTHTHRHTITLNTIT